MIRIIPLLPALAGLLLTGCVATNVPPVDRRVTIAEDLGCDVYVTDVRCAKSGGAYATLQANVVNNTSSDLGVEWRVVWLNAEGVEIDSAVSSWNKLMVSPKDIHGLKNTAPRMDAVDMRFHLRRLR